MKIYLLKDLAEGCVDAVITAETSTEEDISEAIYRAKEKEDYQWDDLVDELPEDCTIYDVWSRKIKDIYY